MSLFREIRRLCLSDKEQIEDILTEIVAEVLRNAPELTLEWLGRIGVVRLADAKVVNITTQYRLLGLPDHGTDSRIDLVIRLVTAAGTHIVFVESKVGSRENAQRSTAEPDEASSQKRQLQIYAELLQEACRQERATGSLVFVTRDFEPVRTPLVEGFDFAFLPTRWFHFYQCLKARRGRDGLERQLKLFMEENNMSLGNQFRSVDLVALEHFLGAKALMDQTLEEVRPRWQEILRKGGAVNKAMTQLRLHNRYTIFTKLSGFEVLLGYWLPHAHSGDPVWAGMMLYCDPKAPARSAIIESFREWSVSQSEWAADGLDNPREWAAIYKGRNLNTFQSGEDHVADLKRYFLSLIDELAVFREQNPKLPWTPSDAADEDET